MILTEIPRSIARFLAAQTFFTTPAIIPVRALCEKDIVAWSAARMEALGISVVVMITRAKAAGQAQFGCLRLDPITIAIRIREHLEINRGSSGTGVAAESLSEVTAALLAGFQPRSGAGAVIGSGIIISDFVQVEDPEQNLFAWEVIATTSGMVKSADYTQLNNAEPESTFDTN